MKISKILSRKELILIMEAIHEAEDMTSGEIKIHLENHCIVDLMDRVKTLFYSLGLIATEHRNAVLIYIAIIDKKVAIIGDEGINRLVDNDFWNKEIIRLTNSFKQSEFTNGIIETVRSVGQKLKAFFPHQTDDINEISDTISFYDN
ncbi:MAG: TPM domain-containing protein [Bacteroidales bacterium]|nr:TPM domain-containing protein [Bacteroidales bacterium]